MPAAATEPFISSPTIVDTTIADFEEETRNAAAAQTEVLAQILRRNAETEYLRDHCGLNGCTDALSFKHIVPVVSHSDIKPFFDRIAQGDRSPVLTAEPIQTLCLSSGTTSDGQHKYLALYKELLAASGRIAKVAAGYRGRAFPTRPGGMFLELVFCGKMSSTPGGLAAATGTTHLFRSKEFKQKQKFAGVRACSPDQVVRHSDNRQAMYCHLLSALLCWEQLEFIASTFVYTIVEALRTLEREWRNLCDDICRGELTSRITDPDLRAAMSELMPKPDPERADTIAAKCSSLEDWSGAIPEIWPHCKYVFSIMTGAMEPYVKQLRHYTGNALPLVSDNYGATESWIGVNANPKAEPRDVTFTVVPSFAYFEFVPIPQRNMGDERWMEEAENVQHDAEEPSPVGLTEVEVGREYEVLLTTYGGLYRYRLGDVVRVTGFFNATPQVAYVCRKNVVLTVNIDKNTEKDLQIAVNEGVDELQRHDGKAELVDFTSIADMSSTPGHYVVYWELNRRTTNRVGSKDSGLEGAMATLDASGGEGTTLDRWEQSQYYEVSVLKKCATAIDMAFADPGYMGSRKVKTIGALELRVVQPGTFRVLLERYLKRTSAAITQYKTPRCITSPEVLSILNSRVLLSVSSAAYA